ncbi:MAG: sigma-70 family RNA polymerase sigma factor [Planctomycetota bacterium]|nr:sigma-70 family RNA polymerase sigma factor [Planctomycetota bacterium]
MNHPPPGGSAERPRGGSPSDDLASDARRAAAGDPDAFQRAHDRLAPGLRRLFGTRSRDRALVEDLCQRTWSAAWEACTQGRYDPDRAALSTFVYAIAHHMWLRHLRGASRPGGAPLPDLPGDDAGSSTDAAHLSGALQCVREAMDGRAGDLSEQERWVLRLAGEGATDRTIAERLRISPSTAHQARKSAVAKLRRLLARRGYRDESDERPGPQAEQLSGGSP